MPKPPSPTLPPSAKGLQDITKMLNKGVTTSQGLATCQGLNERAFLDDAPSLQQLFTIGVHF